MAIKANNKTDWGELFDKFATVPDKLAAGADPKRQEALAKKKQAKPQAQQPKETQD